MFNEKNMENYQQNDQCRYSLSSLKPQLYVFTRGTVNPKTDNGHAEATVVRGANPRVYLATSVIFTEEASLDERYSFRKTLTVTVDGYNRRLNDITGILGVESMDGTIFILNPEFNATVEYEYRLDSDEDHTVYTFTMTSNWPTLKTNFTHKTPDDCPSLKLKGAGDLYMTEFGNAVIDSSGDLKISVPLSKVEYNKDSLTFTERVNEGSYIQKLTFDINFGAYKAYWAYDMIEFLFNTYAVKIDRKGNGFLLCGWQGERGMQPEYSIETSRDEKGKDIIKMTFIRKGMYSVVADQSDITEDSLTSWEFVEEVNGRSTMVCVGVGVAMYTMKREVNAFGTPTGRYMQHVNFDYSDWGINLVTEEFSEYKSKEDPSCLYGGCYWMQNNMPSIVEFNYPYQQLSFNLQNACGFNIVNRPTWVEVNATSGDPEELKTITVTNATYDPAKGYMTVLDAKGAAYVTKFVYDPTNIINNRNRSVTAQGQTLTFTLNVPIDDLQIYGMSDNLIVEFVQPDIMKVTITRNTTGSPRNLIVSLRNTLNGVTDTATIVQDKIYTKRVLNGYLCYNGGKYEKYDIYESYYPNGDYIKTGEVERGDLIDANAVECTGEYEKYEDLGDYVCDGSLAYHAIMRYVSHDGGTTWEPTGEIELGEPWETQVSCSEVEEHYVLTDKWQCLYNE